MAPTLGGMHRRDQRRVPPFLQQHTRLGSQPVVDMDDIVVTFFPNRGGSVGQKVVAADDAVVVVLGVERGGFDAIDTQKFGDLFFGGAASIARA